MNRVLDIDPLERLVRQRDENALEASPGGQHFFDSQRHDAISARNEKPVGTLFQLKQRVDRHKAERLRSLPMGRISLVLVRSIAAPMTDRPITAHPTDLVERGLYFGARGVGADVVETIADRQRQLQARDVQAALLDEVLDAAETP